MHKSKNKKRKERNSSDNDKSCNKVRKQRGPSGGSTSETQVSDILNVTNSVLYGDVDNLDSSVFGTLFESADIDNTKACAAMADTNSEPTNLDLMNLLKNMSGRLETVEKKLGGIETIEKRMVSLEKDINKLWGALDARVKKVDERVIRLEDKVDGADIHTAELAERTRVLEKERDALRDDVSYLQSQSMRNNLVFFGVPEDNTNGSEPAEATERKLRLHLQDAFKIAKETAESIRFERVHRSPGSPITGKIRNIIAKFTYFKDREMIRKSWKQLDGTTFRVFEQFPPDVIQKRRKLVPQLKEARRQNKKAYLAYDTLYIDGTAVRA
ncbi:uncharacterized protein LOC128223149 [Mya arenaria]|uniref:uncharacterized protein LOC128223149 n=1 Tax=Mya arenaria TaxID=6604 RepID=UPI0022DF0FBF|nr:uncharacterized protein LOC128223149 [Mya arenaria]